MSRGRGRHAIPLAGSTVLLGVYMGGSLYVVPHMHHWHEWVYPLDLWNYFFLARYIDIGIYQDLYGQTLGQTGLTTTPGLSSCWHQCGRSVMRPESGSTCRPALSYDQLCGSYSALIKCSSALRHCSPRTQWPYASEPRERAGCCSAQALRTRSTTCSSGAIQRTPWPWHFFSMPALQRRTSDGRSRPGCSGPQSCSNLSSCLHLRHCIFRPD